MSVPASKLTKEMFLKACDELLSEEGGHGPAVGFNFSGDLMGTTYAFDEDAESPVFLSCVDSLLSILNRELQDTAAHA